MKPFFLIFSMLIFLLIEPSLMAQPKITHNNASWNTKQLKKYFKEFQLQDDFIEALINKGYFRAEQQCPLPDTIHPCFLPDTALAMWHLQATDYKKLKGICYYLYSTLPTAYYDRLPAFNHQFNIQPDSVNYFLQLAKLGQLTFICTHFVQITKLMWQHYIDTNNTVVKNITLLPTPHSAPHAINLFYFKTDKGWQGVVADAQYGYLFPIKNDTAFYLVNEMQVYETSYFTNPKLMQYAPAAILNHKRFLTNRMWPCNLGQYAQRTYYRAPPAALYALEMHEKDPIEMLDIQHFDAQAYRKKLLQLLIDNRPR